MREAAILAVYAAGPPEPRLIASDIKDPRRRVTAGRYTPVLSATGGTNVLGSGALLNGWWMRTGLLVSAWVDFYSGTSPTLAGTSWRFTLPFTPDTSLHTPGDLAAASTGIGYATTRSGTATQCQQCAVLLSGASDMIFYGPGTNSSLGSADFTTDARIHAEVTYMAASSNF